MAKHDFKTAAAKLLAQHSVKGGDAEAKYVHGQEKTERTSAVAPQATRIQVEAPARPAASPVAARPPVQAAPSDEEKPDRESGSKFVVPLVSIGLATAFMVFAVPKLMFGIGMNIALGILTGALFGYIVSRD